MLAAALLSMALALGAAVPGTPEVAAAVAPAANLPVNGLLPTPQFRRYATTDGLPSSSVYAVVQDRDGAIWFGTKGGIARYDGVDFKVFRHAVDDPGSLYDNGIASLLFDRDGTLWAAGLEAGLNRYDAASGHFTHWGNDPHDPASLSSDKVWSMVADADGNLWIGTVRGLDRMRPDHRGFEHVTNPLLGTDPAAFGLVAALYVDARQQLWIGSSRGLFRRDIAGSMHRVSQAGTALPIDAWHIDGDAGEIRVESTHGLLLVGSDDVARPLASAGAPDGNVFASARDRNGRLWIGTQRGLFVQMQPSAPMLAVTDQPVLHGDLPGTWVWSMLVDHEGGLWVTMLDGGVGYLAPGWNDTSRFTHIPDDPTSLRDSIVTAMARGHDGRVWVGERSGRVDKLDPHTGKVEHVLSGLGGDVLGMTQDPQERLWIAVRGALYRDTLGQPPQRIDPDGHWLKHPLEVESGPDGRMYARTFGEGLFRIDQDTLAVTRVAMDQPNQRVLWGSQLTLHGGYFWYASDGGMLRMSPDRDRFEVIPGVTNDRAVNAFDFDDGGIWMVRPEALEHYHYRDDALVLDRTVDASQGWPSINVVDLQIDAMRRIWMLGHDGLWRFDPRTGRFRSFGLQNGLANGEFSRGYAVMPDGNLYAPTLGGVAGFNPDRIRDDTTVSPLAVTQVSVRRDGKLQPLAPQQTITLGWKDRGLNVATRLFSYVDPAANHYRFRLRGFDSTWIDNGNHGEREFTGLGAGDYTLEVQAAGANGQWVHLAHPLQIQVQAPPWQRWWAWLGYVLIALLGIWFGLWIWRRRLARRHHVAMVEQQRQMAEAASAAKSQFLATLSHEIRTPMTGVMGMAELLLSTPLNPLQHDYTQAMQRSGGMLLKLLNDALDLARIEAGRLELEPSPFDPRQLLSEVAQLEQGLAHAKGLRFVLEMSDDLPAQWLGDALRIKQVLLNLANNALKFTEHGEVILRARRSDDGLLCSVSDTGPGISEASQARLFQRFEQADSPQRRVGSGLGLAICRELVDMMGGSIELESQLGHGSTFHVHMSLAEPAVAMPVDEFASGRHYRLLLVEDDPIVATVICGLLEREGHKVKHVGNGLAALGELAHAPFDAALLDLDLPGVDGFQIARLIRQREHAGQHLPLLAVTARSGNGDEAKARESGMDGFLRKPVSGEQLITALARVVPGTVASEELPA
ncbi:response regulator [Rhodanobacter sp. FDAARGOS 1247]|uniref:hybrid sensor histidine kinase/response regulator n=1 Tax=Rhodanobacter sp. FDAARGOS 1247 TaxID=2778082 RepID=UPI001950BB42|nr:hybrid sensor histidine kinase/response regulator [Rhodanobacter sp. FDAARGOS 1247]QRP64574.1 response regulator [Rhodanobacter sp. FDAARGOS 1247]